MGVELEGGWMVRLEGGRMVGLEGGWMVGQAGAAWELLRWTFGVGAVVFLWVGLLGRRHVHKTELHPCFVSLSLSGLHRPLNRP